MRRVLSIILWIACILCFLLGIAEAQGTKTIILQFTEGQQPQIFKMPQYAYSGMRPLTKEDNVVDACEFEAKGKNIYSKATEFYFKAMDYFLKSNRFIMPDKMRMLTVVKNENKAFSMSGNVSASFSNSTSNSSTLTNPGQQVAKTGSDTISSSGGIFPSYSKSWTDQKFEIWFFLTE